MSWESVWLSDYFSCPLLFAVTKAVTLAHTAIFENHNSLRSAFKIHCLNQKLVLNWYHNYLSVGKDTKLLEFFYIVTGFFTPGHTSVCKRRSECVGWVVESREAIRVPTGSHQTSQDTKQISFSLQPQSSCYRELHHFLPLPDDWNNGGCEARACMAARMRFSSTSATQ